MNSPDDKPPSPPAEANRPSAATIAMLVIIVLLGAVVRIATANGSLWLDELHTAWTVQEGWEDLTPRAAIGNQSPMFFRIVKASTDLFGASEWTLRLPSLLAGVGLIALAWHAIRQWTGNDAAALFAALAVALDPWCVLFSAEARAYAVVSFVGLVQLVLLSESLTEATWMRRVVWVVVGAFLFYLHYTAALLLAAEVVAMVVLKMTGRGTSYALWLFAIDLVALVLLCLPACEHLADIAARREAWAIFIPKASFQGFFQLFPLYSAMVLVIVITAIGSAWRKAAASDESKPQDSEPRDLAIGAILVAAWLLVPCSIALAATISDQARLLFLRYLSPSLIAVPLLAGLALASIPQAWLRFANGGVLVVALLILPARWPIDATPIGLLLDGHGWVPPSGQDWRGAVQFIDDYRDPKSAIPPDRWPVLVASGFIEADRLEAEPENELLKSYCLSPVNSLYRVKTSNRALIPLGYKRLGPLEAEAFRALQYRDSAWLLVIGGRRNAEWYIDELDKELEKHGSRVVDSIVFFEQFPGVTICKLQITRGP